MAQLSITFIDVGWGDSILLEAVDGSGNHHFGLVDSNDTSNSPGSRLYLKRHFERYEDTAAYPRPYPLFSFVVASHAHADHVAGLQGVLRHFGTDTLYTPRFDRSNSAALSRLISWAQTATRNHLPVARRHRYLDSSSASFWLGPVEVRVLWPPPPPAWDAGRDDPHDPRDENNNSTVLSLELDSVRMVLTGDCQAENWVSRDGGASWPIPLPASGLKLVQVPHHGARNGLFDPSGGTPLFDQIAQLAAQDPSVEPLMAVSCHPVPHGHPHPSVAAELDALPVNQPFGTCVAGTHWLRTDRNLTCTVWTNGTIVQAHARPPA